jgi:hypothetical protein
VSGPDPPKGAADRTQDADGVAITLMIGKRNSTLAKKPWFPWNE